MVRRRISQGQRSLTDKTAFERAQQVRVPGPVGSPTLVPAWLAEARLAAGADADGTPLGVTRQDIEQNRLAQARSENDRSAFANRGMNLKEQEADDARERMERDFRLRLEDSRESNNLARRRQGLAEQSTAFDAKLADRRQQIDAAYRDQQLRLAQGQFGLAEREFLTDAQQNQFRNDLAGNELTYRMAKDTPGLLGLTPGMVGGYDESETGLDPYLEQQWQIQSTKGLEQQLATYRKGVANAELTPEGKRMYGEWAGKVRAIEGQRDVLRPAQYNQMLNKALGEYERLGLEDQVMEPPTVGSEMESRFQDLGNGMGVFLNGDKLDVREIDPARKAQIELEAKMKEKGMMVPGGEDPAAPPATMLETFQQNPKAFEEAKKKAEERLRAKWASRPENELKNPASYDPEPKDLIDEVQRQFDAERRQWEMIRQRSVPEQMGPTSPSDLPADPSMERRPMPHPEASGRQQPPPGGPVNEDRLLPSFRENAPRDVNNARRLLDDPPAPEGPPPMNDLPGDDTPVEQQFREALNARVAPIIESDPKLKVVDDMIQERFGMSLGTMIDPDTINYHAKQGSEDPVADAVKTMQKVTQTRTRNINLMKPMERAAVKKEVGIIESTDSEEYRNLPEGSFFRDGEGFIYRKPIKKRKPDPNSLHKSMRNPSGMESLMWGS